MPRLLVASPSASRASAHSPPGAHSRSCLVAARWYALVSSRLGSYTRTARTPFSSCRRRQRRISRAAPGGRSAAYASLAQPQARGLRGARSGWYAARTGVSSKGVPWPRRECYPGPGRPLTALRRCRAPDAARQAAVRTSTISNSLTSSGLFCTSTLIDAGGATATAPTATRCLGTALARRDAARQGRARMCAAATGGGQNALGCGRPRAHSERALTNATRPHCAWQVCYRTCLRRPGGRELTGTDSPSKRGGRSEGHNGHVLGHVSRELHGTLSSYRTTRVRAMVCSVVARAVSAACV